MKRQTEQTETESTPPEILQTLLLKECRDELRTIRFRIGILAFILTAPIAIGVLWLVISIAASK